MNRPLHPLQAITDAPIDYEAKCKRRRTDGPTPCLCCPGECYGEPLVTLDRTLIAFTGLAGTGKSTAAARLVDAHGYQRIRFAGPLKSMLAALGLTHAEIEGDRKEIPCELLGGRTPRWAMQTIGTEWGRNCIDRDLWIRAWRRAFDRTLLGSCIVVDDCRFPNEAAAIKAAGGLIVRIDRPGARVGAAGHSSEGQELPTDHVLANVGTIDNLFSEVDTLARDMSWAVAGT